MDMESSSVDKEIRDELSVAFNDIQMVDNEVLMKDLKSIIDMYYNDEELNLEEMDEDDDDGTHIFYALDRLKKVLER